MKYLTLLFWMVVLGLNAQTTNIATSSQIGTGTNITNVAYTGGGGGGGCTPVYTNGNQTSVINVTAFVGLFNNANGATNMVGGSQAGRFWFNGMTLDGSQFITLDFTNATKVTEIKWFMDTASAQGVWQWSGSQDDVTYTPIGGTYVLGGAVAVNGVSTNIITTLNGNTTSYRYYKDVGVSGVITSFPFQLGLEAKSCQ